MATKQNVTAQEEELTAKEVCAELGISEMTLHRRINAGEITPLPKAPGHKRHYRLKFKRSDVEKLKDGN